MRDYQREFIELALEVGALRFGQFTLKSGRHSPYFFNTGLFNTGRSAARRGRSYAAAVVASGIGHDMLFGPAYKGIPLVALTAAALADHHGLDKPFSFNRKEIKDHGEGGTMVGAVVAGGVLILDDVITAGTAIRESVTQIRQAGGTPAGVVLALDRQERGGGTLSAVQEVRENFGIPVSSIITLDKLIEFLEEAPAWQQFLPQVRDYRAQFGVAT